MTNEEICREYRQAKDPKKQVEILADCNQTTKSAIVDILRAGGEKVPGNYKPKKIETPEAAMKEATQPSGWQIFDPASGGLGAAETPEQKPSKRLIALEDILDIFVGVLQDWREAPEEVDRDAAAKTTLAYMAGVADAYEAMYGPIVR